MGKLTLWERLYTWLLWKFQVVPAASYQSIRQQQDSLLYAVEVEGYNVEWEYKGSYWVPTLVRAPHFGGNKTGKYKSDPDSYTC